MRCQECLAARGGPAVDSNLNQGFFDLIDRYTAGDRGIRVNAQLLKAAESSEDSKRQDTPCLLVEPGATPRITPSQFRDGVLKCHHEVIRTRKVRVDVLRAEYLSSCFETLRIRSLPWLASSVLVAG